MVRIDRERKRTKWIDVARFVYHTWHINRFGAPPENPICSLPKPFFAGLIFLNIIYKAQRQTYSDKHTTGYDQRATGLQRSTRINRTSVTQRHPNHNEPLIDPQQPTNCDRPIATADQLRAIDPQRPMHSDQSTASSTTANRLTASTPQ